MSTDTVHTDRQVRTFRIAGAAWLAAAVAYLLGEAVAAGGFAGYSYATNYISDLGVPEVGEFQGRSIDSPLHLAMNTAFIVQGLLFAVAAFLVSRDAPATRTVTAFRALAVVHALGIVMVGLIPGSQTSVDAGVGIWHVVGAGLAIIGGNLAIMLGGRLVHGRRTFLGRASVVVGAVGLACLVMLLVDSSTSAVDLLPDGVWERGAVYTVIAWEALVGAGLLARGRRAAPVLNPGVEK